ncbi:MAG: hypothetical protein ACXAD7_17580 [Candidatus Kariarchaeaceae archaeon]
MEISKEDAELLDHYNPLVLDVMMRKELMRKVNHTNVPSPIISMLKILLKDNQKQPLLRYIMDLKRRSEINLQ